MNNHTDTMQAALDAFLAAARRSDEYAKAERKGGRLRNAEDHDRDADEFRAQARAMREAINAAQRTA